MVNFCVNVYIKFIDEGLFGLNCGYFNFILNLLKFIDWVGYKSILRILN